LVTVRGVGVGDVELLPLFLAKLLGAGVLLGLKAVLGAYSVLGTGVLLGLKAVLGAYSVLGARAPSLGSGSKPDADSVLDAESELATGGPEASVPSPSTSAVSTTSHRDFEVVCFVDA
jgi:hypothetical protein